MLKLSDLAQRSDFKLGPLLVSPSRRWIRGPSGESHVEPVIMQVFLLLADARGEVLTRGELFDRIWGSVIVGDDSLNRAIGGVRRAVAKTGAALEVETIPRTGYRLTGPDLLVGADETAEVAVSRRGLMLSAAAIAGLAAVGTSVWWERDRSGSRVARLVEDGQRRMQEAWPDPKAQGVEQFQRAVQLDPGNASAWGYLALALRNVAEQVPATQTSAAVMKSEAAAKRALALDPKEPNALVAMATVRPEFGNWGQTEDSLRRVLRIAPDNVAALTYLVMILQSVGRARDSWDLNEKAAALEPLSPVHMFRRGLKLWIFGNTERADIAIDRALQLWPRHPAVWNARMYIFAFTGRADAAARMVDDRDIRPATMTEASANRWRASLSALDSPTSSNIARARTANIEAAIRSPGLAVPAIMTLSALGELDAAFAVTDGFLLRRGPLVGSLWMGRAAMPVNDHHWRRTMSLFTPANDAMRRDPRFGPLCEGIGLTRYWKERGGPDAFLMQS